MIDYTWVPCVGKNKTRSVFVSEPFVIQVFKFPARPLVMNNSPASPRLPPIDKPNAGHKSDETGVASELDKYPLEVLEALLMILKARREAEIRST